MTKRRDFIKNTLGITAGITAAGTGLSTLSSCSSEAEQQVPQVKDWHSDPEWRKVKYGEWNGPGVNPGPGPMDGVLLKNYAPRSTVVSQHTKVPKARLPVIDVHSHHYARESKGNVKDQISKWVETQKEVGVDKTVILAGTTGESFDKMVKLYLEPFPDQFLLYCGLERKGIDTVDYPERAAKELERCYKMGARGIGELSDKGFGYTRDEKLKPEERLHPEDDRLDLFWRKAAELGLPVVTHISDHPSAWTPPDVFQERTPIFQQYNKHGGSGEHYEDILKHLPAVVQKHPETTFIACHIANLGNDLQRVSDLLDRYPNLYLDISARDYEIGRTPRASKRFFEKYQDRVLYGSDMGMDKSMYQAWWRLLESDDEYMTGRVWWPYYGLDLSEDTLEALYRGNAERILNWG